MNWRTRLDTSPVARLALALMRDGPPGERLGRPVVPARPAALQCGTVVAFWSLVAGVGASTVAALVAQRSGGAGAPTVLVDLDRWAPSLALRAARAGATVSDALLRPGAEGGLLSRWSDVAFLPGRPDFNRMFDGPRVAELVRSVGRGRATVLDLGAGADALDHELLASIDRLCLVAGARIAQLQAAFCAVPLLAPLTGIGLVVVGAADEDARRIAARLPWPLLSAIPYDPHLAHDEFATRAPTMRAIDALVRRLA